MHKIIFFALSLLALCSCSTLQLHRQSPKQVVSAFMHDLFASDHDLLRDEGFKEKYLSKSLRDRISASISQYSTYQPPKEAPWALHPAYPDKFNKTIFMAWDLPTSYKVHSQQVTGDKATVDVTYSWGPDTQYAGDTRLTSVTLTLENDSWHIDDLYTHKGKFVSDLSLYQSLLK